MRVVRTMGQRSSLSSPESANPFAIKPMTGARNSTRLNYVPMGLRGRGRAEGISKFASRIVPAGEFPFHSIQSFNSVTEPTPSQ